MSRGMTVDRSYTTRNIGEREERHAQKDLAKQGRQFIGTVHVWERRWTRAGHVPVLVWERTAQRARAPTTAVPPPPAEETAARRRANAWRAEAVPEEDEDAAAEAAPGASRRH